MAAGMTTSELSAELADRLDEKFLVNPQVAIELEESYSYRVTVEGEVEEPGIFPVRGQMSLLQSVALAGGASEDASLTNVYVMRNVDNQKMIARFDLRDVRTGKMMDPALLPGDTVVVGLASARRLWRELLTVLPSLAGVFIAVEQNN
jgi:polysaccharide export outer membrane protein